MNDVPEGLPPRERVRLPGRETEIWIGSGVREHLLDRIRAAHPAARAAGIVVDRTVDRLWSTDLECERGDDALEIRRVVAPPGEAAKTREELARLQDALLDLRREEPVIVVGGGAVLDAGGFAAATVRRGLPWIAVPTTVVGMADASVGGKVAVNHERGKNLLGTFHPPHLVLVDPDYLRTVERRDQVAGLAEIYKVARIGDEDLLARLRRTRSPTAQDWEEVLRRAIRVKARLVEEDERDHGVRRLLNYGHTVGHALEGRLGNERMRHGEAVALGMGVAARIACLRGDITLDALARQDADLADLGLPTRWLQDVAAADVLAAMALDKKRRPGARHVFVLPREEGGLQVVEDVTDAEVVRAVEDMP